MPTAPQTLPFQAEVKELLGLMVHSLYSHREVFLRELVSNASDALDKLRFEALTRPELFEPSPHLAIRLEVERTRRILRVIDTGIGMTQKEVAENLGTLARSGTRRFLEAARAGEQAPAGALPQLIGQFGVGFYASFMVADEITVDTRRAGEATGTRWRSRGDGEFTIEELDSAPRGTQVELHLKPPSEDEEGYQDFTDPELLRELVRRYSDFVEYPIEMAAAHFPAGAGLKKEKAPDGVEVVVLNSRKPLWARPKDEVTADEHAEFYRHLSHGFGEPLETIHFKAEGSNEYTALLYIPSERPLDLFDPSREKSRVSLYVRRVFVMADCEELLPPWLRFVRGVVDAADLPLNVSREILQENRAVRQIRRRLLGKVLDSLERMLAERRADYERFWRAFGPVLKEGIVLDPEQSEKIAALCLFESSRGEGPTTIPEYLERAGESHNEIYVLQAADRATAERSPHLEALKKRNQEVLFLVDPIDEWVAERLREFRGHPLKPIDRGEATSLLDEQREELEQKERELRPLLETLEHALSEKVEKIRFSPRLTESPAVLVDQDGTLGPHMERLLRETGQAPPRRRRVLELNPTHPVVERLERLHAEEPTSPRLAELAELLHGQALLAEGSPLPDPARFGKLVSDLMVRA